VKQLSEFATFAAGCFWGVEAAFRAVPGVLSTRVGYIGGSTDSPTYKQVCRGKTGHAESVEVTFDPAVFPYEGLLGVFWNKHNPRTRNRQGLDIGSQYRSAIFTDGPEQQATASAAKERLEKTAGRFRRPLATTIEPAPTFWAAEEYHQQYLEKQGRATSALCARSD